MQYSKIQQGHFLLEILIAIGLFTLTITSFTTYSLKQSREAEINQQELIMAQQLTILSERLYHATDVKSIVQKWQQEVKQKLPQAEVIFVSTLQQKSIRFKISEKDKEREFLL